MWRKTVLLDRKRDKGWPNGRKLVCGTKIKNNKGIEHFHKLSTAFWYKLHFYPQTKTILFIFFHFNDRMVGNININCDYRTNTKYEKHFDNIVSAIVCNILI